MPWPLAAAVLGTTSIGLGLLWDISWHASIGRDTFWTPAHLAIYLGGVVCGLAAGWLALATTFAGTDGQRAVAVRVWGFQAPLGAWVAIWGAVAMLTSAPFDDWWHNAYGVDVKIISPPHLLLAAGIFANQLGAMLQALAAQNRSAAGAPAARVLAIVYAYAAGGLLVIVSTLFLEYSEPNRQHGALFYEISCAAYPLVLVAAARGIRLRWPATSVAAVYMAVRLAVMWVLPLFPATPRLAPIYNPVRHLWPPFFPELLIVPAVLIDLLLRRAARRDAMALPEPGRGGGVGGLGRGRGAGGPGRGGGAWDRRGPWSRSGLALMLGAAFFVSFLAAHWAFSTFMLTPAARNWFFAADQWTYRTRPGEWHHEFWLDGDAFGPRAAALSLLLAAVSARLGLAWGDWMSRVRR